jgi:hypothetical protein
MIIKEVGNYRIEKDSVDGLVITQKFEYMGGIDWEIVFGNKTMNPKKVYDMFEILTKD